MLWELYRAVYLETVSTSVVDCLLPERDREREREAGQRLSKDPNTLHDTIIFKGKMSVEVLKVGARIIP